jgi:hypothetical protein
MPRSAYGTDPAAALLLSALAKVFARPGMTSSHPVELGDPGEGRSEAVVNLDTAASPGNSASEFARCCHADRNRRRRGLPTSNAEEPSRL